MELSSAVSGCDDKLVRRLLDDSATKSSALKEQGELYLQLLDGLQQPCTQTSTCRRHIIYMLRNAGIDVNYTDQAGDTALHKAVLQQPCDVQLCEALLQCGADLCIQNQLEMTPIQCAALPNVAEPVRDLLKKYSPGLWMAVEEDDLMSVRKLINLWCRVDIEKDGLTLKELALSKGTEHIIRLILDIGPSMRLAHSVMAGDVVATRELFSSGAQIRMEFRNLGDMGATPLFYAIMQNNIDLVQTLRNKGAKIDTLITFQDEDIPVFFVALNKETAPEIIKNLLPIAQDSIPLERMQYRGQNILLHCIDNDVCVSAVRYILQQGYAHLVASRNQRNQCPRQVAEQQKKMVYVKLIDEVVHDWYLHSNDHRKTLALLGYEYLRQAQKEGVPVSEVVSSMETSSDPAKFDTQLDAYQEHIGKLHSFVEIGDLEQVKGHLQVTCEHPEQFITCLVDSRAKGDGQPLLHKAVLRNHGLVTELLCRTAINVLKVKLDDLRDPWYRTPLHYAYGLKLAKEAVNILSGHGASDFTMDMDSRSPLVFRDYRHSVHMQDLLHYHINRSYTNPEPKPWEHSQKVQFVQCPHHQKTTATSTGGYKGAPTSFHGDGGSSETNAVLAEESEKEEEGLEAPQADSSYFRFCSIL